MKSLILVRDYWNVDLVIFIGGFYRKIVRSKFKEHILFEYSIVVFIS